MMSTSILTSSPMSTKEWICIWIGKNKRVVLFDESFKIILEFIIIWEVIRVTCLNYLKRLDTWIDIWDIFDNSLFPFPVFVLLSFLSLLSYSHFNFFVEFWVLRGPIDHLGFLILVPYSVSYFNFLICLPYSGSFHIQVPLLGSLFGLLIWVPDLGSLFGFLIRVLYSTSLFGFLIEVSYLGSLFRFFVWIS